MIAQSCTAFLDDWFAEELAPLYERKQRLLQESLAREDIDARWSGAIRA